MMQSAVVSMSQITQEYKGVMQIDEAPVEVNILWLHLFMQ